MQALSVLQLDPSTTHMRNGKGTETLLSTPLGCPASQTTVRIISVTAFPCVIRFRQAASRLSTQGMIHWRKATPKASLGVCDVFVCGSLGFFACLTRLSVEKTRRSKTEPSDASMARSVQVQGKACWYIKQLAWRLTQFMSVVTPIQL